MRTGGLSGVWFLFACGFFCWFGFFTLWFLQKTFNHVGVNLHHSMYPERTRPASVITQSCGLCFPRALKIAQLRAGTNHILFILSWGNTVQTNVCHLFCILIVSLCNISSDCILDALSNWHSCISLLNQDPFEILWFTFLFWWWKPPWRKQAAFHSTCMEKGSQP